MRFLSNFGCKTIFTCSVNFWRQHWSRDLLVQVAYWLKPRASGRNTVGQQLSTSLDVTCCVRFTLCCMLLDVVACCCAKFETGQTFQLTTPNISFVPWWLKRSATMLDPFAQLFQHCWGHARSLRMDYKDLWVVFFPRCTAGLKLVGSCCIRLHTTGNTYATTSNIVGAAMLEVVAPVCTQPNRTVSDISCRFRHSICQSCFFSACIYNMIQIRSGETSRPRDFVARWLHPMKLASMHEVMSIFNNLWEVDM